MYRTGYDACLRNADQYINDTRALIEKKSYGHALGLAILGKEELAKATGYFLISWGVVDTGSKAGKKLLKLLHKRHEIKIGFASMLLSVPDAISKLKDLVPEIVKEQTKHTRDKRELIRRTYDGLFDSPTALSVFKTVDEHVRKGGEIQRLKLEGLYVGIDENGEVITPNKITEAEAATQLEELEGNRKIIGEMPTGLDRVPPADSQIFKEWTKQVWDQIAKELEKSTKPI
jgi:AbiV family abortive infection protein